MRSFPVAIAALFAAFSLATASPVAVAANAPLTESSNGLTKRNDFIPHGKDALIDFYVEYGSGANDYFNLISKLSWNPAGYFDRASNAGSLAANLDNHGTLEGVLSSRFTFLDRVVDFIVDVEFFYDTNGKIYRCALVTGRAQWQTPHSIPLDQSTHHRCFVNGIQGSYSPFAASMRSFFAAILAFYAFVSLAIASPIESAVDSDVQRDMTIAKRSDLVPHGKDALVVFHVEYGSGVNDYFTLVSKLSWNPEKYFDAATHDGNLKVEFNGHGAEASKNYYSEFTFLDRVVGMVVTIQFFHNDAGRINRCALLIGSARWPGDQSVGLDETTTHRCYVNGIQVKP
ncbi:uncharacterized protein L969DRAFT_623272 [Mixia osmundae IAM 14324]|uniref:Uncharacterized protein n=1 Tax=Mixia osmundae (strain CBS 9802 / IAM 14324 / JCM 22182 / KY 12970) TaxID=764103 RepID=G7E423_MIXOS|nr:uncharacterized protein L969DRAFT_623272 [Mixia osmundae IAM 14324]KEI39676.1 hypothetical protein L969DRAFT_623272 [Mixia osmundae IAM 14324]GAA97583.1 hypothetical protein E5Q_04261 [Mixia osmundae IAM 14324]